jgi:hypothetical protein
MSAYCCINLDLLIDISQYIGASICISLIFLVMWVSFMSAYQSHIEIGPQFEFCLSACYPGRFYFQGFCGHHRVLLGCYALRLLDAEDESTVVILFKCRYLFVSQDAVTLQKTLNHETLLYTVKTLKLAIPSSFIQPNLGVICLYHFVFRPT